jgi:energy-coupling factor transporter ATP-binding protein EcfA2
MKGYYHLLWDSPRISKPDGRYSKASNKVGYLMSEQHKKFALEKYIGYVRENIDKFYFIDQIEEHIAFNMEENRFDRTIASMLCIIQDNEMADRVIEEAKEELVLPYWRYDEFGNFVFK